MKISIKNGPTKNHFSELKAGDTFIFAEDTGTPVEKWSVFMKTTECKGACNAVNLRNGESCFVPGGCIAVKVETELSVVV